MPTSTNHHRSHPSSPVAGRDFHAPQPLRRPRPLLSPRNLLLLKDSAGRTGIGEVPAAKKSAKPSKTPANWWSGREITQKDSVMDEMLARFAERDAAGRGVQNVLSTRRRTRNDGRRMCHAGFARPERGVPVAALLGTESSETVSRALGYVFYVGDWRKTPIFHMMLTPARKIRGTSLEPRSPDARRHRAACRGHADKYGFTTISN